MFIVPVVFGVCPQWLKLVQTVYKDNITQSSIHIHTHKKRKRKNIYISMLPKSTASIWDDSFSIHVFHRCRVHHV